MFYWFSEYHSSHRITLSQHHWKNGKPCQVSAISNKATRWSTATTTIGQDWFSNNALFPNTLPLLTFNDEKEYHHDLHESKKPIPWVVCEYITTSRAFFCARRKGGHICSRLLQHSMCVPFATVICYNLFCMRPCHWTVERRGTMHLHPPLSHVRNFILSQSDISTLCSFLCPEETFAHVRLVLRNVGSVIRSLFFRGRLYGTIFFIDFWSTLLK